MFRECAGTSMLRNALKLKRTDTFSRQGPMRKMTICTTRPGAVEEVSKIGNYRRDWLS